MTHSVWKMVWTAACAGGVALLMAVCLAVSASAKTWTVRPNDLSGVIVEAVEGSRSGDSILVYPGVYKESGIVIDKPLSLIGVGFPVVDGEETATIFTIVADSVRFEGFEVRNVGLSFMEDRAGLRLADVKHCVVVNNRFIDNFFAIYLENVGQSIVRGNHIVGSPARETSTANGIHLWHCRGVTIEDNHIESHRDGIYFEFVEESTVRNNVSMNNVRYGLHFMFSHDDVYDGNVFKNNSAGVAVMFSDRVEMTDNEFRDSWGPASFGILLKDIRDSNMSGNWFDHNTIGVYSEGSMRLDIHHNRFTSNGYALKIMASSNDVSFHDNNFIGNTFDVSTNSKHSSNSYDGNYWSNYNGYDLDKDGVGDVPYRPVHLFSLLVEREPAGLILLRSFFIDLVDAAERVMPLYTPPTLLDNRPFTSPVVAEVAP